MPGGSRDVEVTVDRGNGTKAPVPVRRLDRSTPLRELRVPQNPRRLSDQWEMVDENGRKRRIAHHKSSLGIPNTRIAPSLPTRVRIGVKEELIDTDDARGVRLPERLLSR